MKLITVLIMITSLVVSCKDNKEEKPMPLPLVKKEAEAEKKTVIPPKGPIINMVDTVEIKYIVLSVKDSAATSAGLSAKLSNIFTKKMPEAIKNAKINTVGQPIVWYISQKIPFFFEAGIPVDKSPAKLTKGFFIKKTNGDSAFVAHFFGPNVLSNIGYDAVAEMLKDRNKKKAAPAYEIYINNPFDVTNTKVDPYKQQTDIVLPYK